MSSLTALAERVHSKTRIGKYCNFCGSDEVLAETRDGNHICMECAIDERFCESCGSVRAYEDQPESEQQHYSEECKPEIAKYISTPVPF